jgi:hypothetical protein
VQDVDGGQGAHEESERDVHARGRRVVAPLGRELDQIGEAIALHQIGVDDDPSEIVAVNAPDARDAGVVEAGEAIGGFGESALEGGELGTKHQALEGGAGGAIEDRGSAPEAVLEPGGGPRSRCVERWC